MRHIPALLAALLPLLASAQPMDPRVCRASLADIPRTVSGKIKRSSAEINSFRALWACPATHLNTGACPGWAIDHVIPLADGGCDAVGNMQWLPTAIKSCAADSCKDRWERVVYAR